MLLISKPYPFKEIMSMMFRFTGRMTPLLVKINYLRRVMLLVYRLMDYRTTQNIVGMLLPEELLMSILDVNQLRCPMKKGRIYLLLK